jgi:hypothetical protein
MKSRHRLALYRIRSTGRKRRLMAVSRPDNVLLAALQRGELQAMRNGEEIERKYWSDKDVRHLTDDLCFWQADGLKCWSAVGGGSDQLTSAKSDSCDEEPHSSAGAEPRPEEEDPTTGSPLKLSSRGKERVAEIDTWAIDKYGPGVSELPGRTVLPKLPRRGVLLQLLRADFPDSYVNRDDVAELRRNRATKQAQDGGAPTHDRNRRSR